MRALFYDDLESGEGCIIREVIDGHTALMKDGQHFSYEVSIPEEKLACRKCGNFHTLKFKGDYPDLVSPGYVAVCESCNEDFYLFELIKEETGGLDG